MSGLHVRGRKEAGGKETEGELGDRECPASGPLIFNQGFNLEEHNCFLSRFCRKLLISLSERLLKTTKCTGHKIQAGEATKHPVTYPSTQYQTPKHRV